MRKFNLLLLLIFNFSWIIIANASTNNPVVNLVIAYKNVNFTGKTVKAITFNNEIPGPILHFKEGDHVTINVYNHLDTGTSVHWHGLIVPWNMDGVTGLTQAAIPPGGVYHYQFTLNQSGTYWYHSHAGMQMQQGMIGAFIIDPKHPLYRVNKDIVILLSDWTNTSPEKILANLKNDGEYYEPKFPLQPSLLHFIQSYQQSSPTDRQELIDAYQMMQTMRMSPYDFSDVAYDAFLLNGHTPAAPWKNIVKVGDTIRLRFINGGGGTIFHVKIPHTILKIIAVDGKDVVPYNVNDFEIGSGETYDVLIKINNPSPYLIYAESIDKTGVAEGALITQNNQIPDFATIEPFPEPKPIMMMSGMNMSGMSMSHMNMQGMNMSGMSKQMTMNNSTMTNMNNMKMNNNANLPTQSDTDTKYRFMKSLIKTNDPNKPFQIIKIRLNGYMGRFVWFLNGIPEYKAKPILIEPGKKYRLIFINETMMHHPMHVHGHWFILRNGHGAYDPLLHTIDVPPNATMVADLDATEKSGFWYFHCHNLYHMMSGMGTEFAYPNAISKTQSAYTFTGMAYMHDTMNMTNNLNQNSYTQNYIPSIPVEQGGIYSSNFLDINSNFHDFTQATFNALLGTDYDKLNLYSNEAEIKNGVVQNADMDIFYWHAISEFWAIKGGANYTYRPADTPYWQPGIGIEGLMPYFIETNIRSYFNQSNIKLDADFSRDTQITDNFFIRTGIRSILATKTVADDEIGSGVNDMEYTIRPYYRLMPGFNIYVQYQHTNFYGATKSLRLMDEDETGVENNVTAGFSMLF